MTRSSTLLTGESSAEADVSDAATPSIRPPVSRQTLRCRLYRLIGGWPTPDPRHLSALSSVVPRQTEPLPEGCRVEHLDLPALRSLRSEASMPAVLCLPAGSGPWPVVLYCHAHGSNYAIGKQELLQGRQALSQGPYGPLLARQGIASLAIDLPCFGDRQQPGESALGKSLAWHGDTLFGSMLRDLAAAIDYLQSRPDIDDSRLLAYGLSMGATLSWWLAALDDRVQAVAQVCCFADLHTLVAMGVHDLHGHYMTVPGLLAETCTAQIASLIVPRPHLCALGNLDPLTPPPAIHAATEPLGESYRRADATSAWRLMIEAGVGHEETASMRQAVLGFMNEVLMSRCLAED